MYVRLFVTLSILVPSVAGSGGDEKESGDSVSSDKGGDDAEDVSATPVADDATMRGAASESSSKGPTKSKHGAVTGGEHDQEGFPLHLFDPDNGFESKQLVLLYVLCWRVPQAVVCVGCFACYSMQQTNSATPGGMVSHPRTRTMI